MGTGDQGFQCVQIDMDDPRVLRIRVGGEGSKVLLAALGFQEGTGHFIRGENGGGSAQLRAHVGDGSPLRHGQTGHAEAAPFDHMTHAALDRENPQQFQTDVLGCDKGPEGAGQLHADDFGHIDIVCAAAHGYRHVHAAGAEGQHSNAAAGGSVAVGTDEGLARYAEAFQMYLMADAVAGAGEPDAVLGGNGLDIAVVVGVLKAGLQGVVVDIGNRTLRLDPVDPHGLEFQIGHGAGGVLRQRLVDPQSHLCSRFHGAADQMGGNELFR